MFQLQWVVVVVFFLLLTNVSNPASIKGVAEISGMSSLQKLYQIDRSLDTVFQSRIGNFLGAGMNESTKVEIERTIDDLLVKANQKKKEFIEFITANENVHGVMNMSVGVVRDGIKQPVLEWYVVSMIQCFSIFIGILQDTIKHQLKKDVHRGSDLYKIDCRSVEWLDYHFGFIKKQSQEFRSHYQLSSLHRNGVDLDGKVEKFFSAFDGFVSEAADIQDNLEQYCFDYTSAQKRHHHP